MDSVFSCLCRLLRIPAGWRQPLPSWQTPGLANSWKRIPKGRLYGIVLNQAKSPGCQPLRASGLTSAADCLRNLRREWTGVSGFIFRTSWDVASAGSMRKSFHGNPAGHRESGRSPLMITTPERGIFMKFFLQAYRKRGGMSSAGTLALDTHPVIALAVPVGTAGAGASGGPQRESSRGDRGVPTARHRCRHPTPCWARGPCATQDARHPVPPLRKTMVCRAACRSAWRIG